MNRCIATLLIALLLSGIAAAQPAKMGDYTIVTQVPRLAVESQDNTGTCWCYATTSFLESELERMHGKPVDLSEMFTVRHTYVEKAKRYVVAKGKTVFGQGGLSHDVMAMIREHGIVPQSAYNGLREGQRRHSHGEMERALKGMIDALAKARRLSPTWTVAVGAVLDTYMGKAPTTVEVDGKTMSPKQYADDVLKIPVDDYVEVMSYSYAPFHQEAMLTVQDNWMKYDRYINLPIDEFMSTFDNALKNGYSIAVDIDVSEKTYKPGEGIGTLTEDLEKPGAVTQEVRDAMFKDKRTTDDHLLHIVGIAKDKNGKRFYVTKDSWGATHGRLNGYRMLSENYIRAKVLAYMVHKDAMPRQ